MGTHSFQPHDIPRREVLLLSPVSREANGGPERLYHYPRSHSQRTVHIQTVWLHCSAVVDLILLLHQNTLIELLLCAKGSVTVGNVGERTKRTPS